MTVVGYEANKAVCCYCMETTDSKERRFGKRASPWGLRQRLTYGLTIVTL
jgi:hypothetical protein